MQTLAMFYRRSTREQQELADALFKLGGRAIKILEECVENTSIERKSVSAAARALEDKGFIFINEDDNFIFDGKVRLVASLLGEDALEAMENVLSRK